MLDHLDADMPGEAISQKGIEKTGGTAQNGAGSGQEKFRGHQPPEVFR